MSVHQKPLTKTSGTEITSMPADAPIEPSDVEYTELRADSLAMFGAAIGGAILGMLLTMMVLALTNGGTLIFRGNAEQLAAMEASLQRVNENVGAVSTNVDIVASQTTAIQAELVAAATAFEKEFALQNDAITANEAAIDMLNQTRVQFDILVTALTDSLKGMEAAAGDAAERATEFADENAATSAQSTGAVNVAAAGTASIEKSLPVPMVANSADVPAQQVVVLLFADANGDGFMDEDDISLMGANVALLDGDGETVATATSTETGAHFEKLPSGEYELVVEDVLGYDLLSQPTASVVIGEDDGQGFVVYISVSTVAK